MFIRVLSKAQVRRGLRWGSVAGILVVPAVAVGAKPEVVKKSPAEAAKIKAAADLKIKQAKLRDLKERDQIRIVSLTTSPPVAKPGQMVNVTMVVENASDKPVKNLKWSLSGAHGVLPVLGPKQTHTLTTKFKAPAQGQHGISASVSAATPVSETALQRKNNTVLVQVPVAPASQWTDWSTAAAGQVDPFLSLAAQLSKTKSGIVNGAAAGNIKFEATGLSSTLFWTQLKSDGLPDDVAKAFANTVLDAYTTWLSRSTGTHPNAFPSFVAMPMATAPPTPCVPAPVVAVLPYPTEFGVSALKNALTGRLGPKANESGAKEAIEAFAVATNLKMTMFTIGRQVHFMGYGPVPTFAPPYVPVGSVVAGGLIPQSGVFL